jgi:hypothetical protein
MILCPRPSLPSSSSPPPPPPPPTTKRFADSMIFDKLVSGEDVVSVVCPGLVMNRCRLIFIICKNVFIRLITYNTKQRNEKSDLNIWSNSNTYS